MDFSYLYRKIFDFGKVQHRFFVTKNLIEKSLQFFLIVLLISIILFRDKKTKDSV